MYQSTWVYYQFTCDSVKKIKVYALLDNASGGTFVSEESMTALGIEGSDTDLILATIHGTRSVTTKAIEGLVAANVKEEDVMLELPRTFTRRVIPADRNEIPRPDVIGKMSHLEKISAEIPPYIADIEVVLLIGLNCSSALLPREIVYEEWSDPYAVRSLLGWYVYGPLCTSQQIGKITCNSICVGQEDTNDLSRICSLAENGKGADNPAGSKTDARVELLSTGKGDSNVT